MAKTNTRKRILRKQRALFRIALFASVGIVVTWLGFITAKPFLMAQQMRRENDKTEARGLVDKKQIQRYEHDLAIWETDAGYELIARRYGYIKRGEQRLHIPPR